MGYCGNYCNSTKVCQNDGKCVKTAGKQWDCVVFTFLHTHMNTYISNINITYIYILGGRGPASPVIARNVHLMM